MSYCCANCFDDQFFRKHIFSQVTTIGCCSYCGSSNVRLIEPSHLSEYFELLISIYKLDPNGQNLVELLKKDWVLFPDAKLDIAHSKELLSDILDDGDIVRKKFSLSTSSASATVLQWENLRSELKHVNRFFPQTEINFQNLKELFDFILCEPESISSQWYRARIQPDNLCFSSLQMGAPPETLASHGRANPAGIPYLYLASTEMTAVSEVRPHPGEYVSLAEFKIDPNLKFADLRHPRRTVSPFICSDDNQVLRLLTGIDFLEKLGDELTRPVIPKSAAFEYIPSQYLCEFIKQCGFDGVVYRSSLGNAVNIALFNPSKASCGLVKSINVSKVVVEILD